MPTARWRRRPDGSTWGDFGPDDQIGRLNLITPEKVRQGAAEVREGRTFCLSLPLDYPGGAVLNPRRTPPVQGRGVLVDFHAHFGHERKMVSRDDLLRVMDQDKVVVEKGDMLLLHTGFSQAILDMKKEPDGDKLGSSYAVLDGRDDALLQWITDAGLASLIADNYGVEAVPSRPGSTTSTD